MLTPAPWGALTACGAPGITRGAFLGVHVDRASVLNVLSEVVGVGHGVRERERADHADVTDQTDAGVLGDVIGDGWRVRVTVEDIRDAWDAWLVARDGGAPADRVQDLRDDVDRLVRAAAQQGADDLCAHAVAHGSEAGR